MFCRKTETEYSFDALPLPTHQLVGQETQPSATAIMVCNSIFLLVLSITQIQAAYDPFAEPGKISAGSHKCDIPSQRAVHQHLCDILEQARNGSFEIKGSDERSMRTLYDEYHKDRGNLSTFEFGIALLKMLPIAMPPRKGVRLLEGGVGSCAVLREMKRHGYDTYGHELSAYAIQTFCQGLRVSNGLLSRTPYPDSFFDVIYSVDVMEHIAEADVLPTFIEMFRIARPGALYIFNVAPCSKLSGGIAGTSIIHASGLCDLFPRPWWDQQLETAGFRSCDPVTWNVLEGLAGLKAGEADKKKPEAQKNLRTRNHRKGGMPWNLKYHNWWFFYKPK